MGWGQVVLASGLRAPIHGGSSGGGGEGSNGMSESKKVKLFQWAEQKGMDMSESFRKIVDPGRADGSGNGGLAAPASSSLISVTADDGSE